MLKFFYSDRWSQIELFFSYSILTVKYQTKTMNWRDSHLTVYFKSVWVVNLFKEQGFVMSFKLLHIKYSPKRVNRIKQFIWLCSLLYDVSQVTWGNASVLLARVSSMYSMLSSHSAAIVGLLLFGFPGTVGCWRDFMTALWWQCLVSWREGPVGPFVVFDFARAAMFADTNFVFKWWKNTMFAVGSLHLTQIKY